MLTFSLVAIAASSSTVLAQREMPIRDTILANGLHVIVIENRAVPLVTVELVVKNGSFTETPAYNGLSHLFEHMFFKANRTLPSQERFVARLRELGASWNGSTAEERVSYFVTVETDSVAPSLQFMEDAIRFPLFQKEELIRERPVVIGEFDRSESNPSFHLWRATALHLWGRDYFSRKNVMGIRDTILTASEEKMRAIQNRFNVPNNTALILSGDIASAYGFRLAAEIFDDWPRGADPFPTPEPDPPRLARSEAAIVEQPVNYVALQLSWHGPSVAKDPAATYAVAVLTTILNNPTSPLQKRLVDSGLGFKATISCWAFEFAHVAPINFFLHTTPDKLLEAQRVTLEEFARFADSTYVSQAQLEAARKQLAIRALYEREQSTSLAHTVGLRWAVTGLDHYRMYLPSVQRVTRGDLARFAQRYLEKQPYVVGVLINPEARKALNLTPEALLPKPVAP